MSAKHYRPDPTPLFVIGGAVAFVFTVLFFFGCTGITDTPPQDPPYCTYDGYTRICDGDTVKVKMLGTGNTK